MARPLYCRNRQHGALAEAVTHIPIIKSIIPSLILLISMSASLVEMRLRCSFSLMRRQRADKLTAVFRWVVLPLRLARSSRVLMTSSSLCWLTSSISLAWSTTIFLGRAGGLGWALLVGCGACVGLLGGVAWVDVGISCLSWTLLNHGFSPT